MLGAVGAMGCFAACTGLGLMARNHVQERCAMLGAWIDALETMGLLLEAERLPMGELLMESAKSVRETGVHGKVRSRLIFAGESLSREPSLTVAQAYISACGQIRLSCQQLEERSALELLFTSLGSGTAEMRKKAIGNCLKRLELSCEKARETAEKGGKLYAQLGVLGGMMLGIVLW